MSKAEEVERAWLNWVCWRTLPDTHNVLGQRELGTKGCFSQEHIAVDISPLGLGVLPVWSPLGAHCPPGTASLDLCSGQQTRGRQWLSRRVASV